MLDVLDHAPGRLDPEAQEAHLREVRDLPEYTGAQTRLLSPEQSEYVATFCKQLALHKGPISPELKVLVAQISEQADWPNLAITTFSAGLGLTRPEYKKEEDGEFFLSLLAGGIQQLLRPSELSVLGQYWERVSKTRELTLHDPTYAYQLEQHTERLLKDIRQWQKETGVLLDQLRLAALSFAAGAAPTPDESARYMALITQTYLEVA